MRRFPAKDRVIERRHDRKGIPGFGVYPYVINNDQLIAIHGNNERIRVDALRQGTEFMISL